LRVWILPHWENHHPLPVQSSSRRFPPAPRSPIFPPGSKTINRLNHLAVQGSSSVSGFAGTKARQMRYRPRNMSSEAMPISTRISTRDGGGERSSLPPISPIRKKGTRRPIPKAKQSNRTKGFFYTLAPMNKPLQYERNHRYHHRLSIYPVIHEFVKIPLTELHIYNHKGLCRNSGSRREDAEIFARAERLVSLLCGHCLQRRCFL
jgi:hypothetical protein